MNSIENTQITLPQYKTESTHNGNRIYIADDGLEYISVTSLISKYEDVTGLRHWEERIGLDKANNIRDESIIRGVNAHKVVEEFLNSDKDLDKNDEEIEFSSNDIYANQAIDTFYSKVKSVDNESTVFFKDDLIRYAGRYDSIVNIPSDTFYYRSDGIALDEGYALVDLKTKTKISRLDKVDYLLKYALQGAAYVYAKPEIDIKYFIITFVSDKKCKLICFTKRELAFYFNYFYRLALDYYEVSEDLNISWQGIIKVANYDYDFETDNYVDYIPKEILPYSPLQNITIIT